jgi:hypothetical protein
MLMSFFTKRVSTFVLYLHFQGPCRSHEHIIGPTETTEHTATSYAELRMRFYL